MDTKAAVIALLSVWGVGTCAVAPTLAQEESGDASANPLLNKVWVRAEASDSLPGTMQIFLEDGTLVSDSCWETYRLSKWQQVSDGAISWEEDGMIINAEIASISDTEMVLNLQLGSEIQEQRFVTATAPYVCPDIPD
ncbi:MAG TPA: hypothetical protein VGN79_05805 [Devosia sp.]|jgi:hypothetical protein|nr:hypothetical protein [Devosia sp.]